MEIKHEKTEKAHLVELVGRLDALNNAKAESFFAQITDNPDLSVLVDCAQLDFINSSGLRVLIMGLKKLKAAGKVMVLCDLQKNIKEVFKFSGFNNLFDIELSKEGALQKL